MKNRPKRLFTPWRKLNIPQRHKQFHENSRLSAPISQKDAIPKPLDRATLPSSLQFHFPETPLSHTKKDTHFLNFSITSTQCLQKMKKQKKREEK
jgi:hypothetical protein